MSGLAALALARSKQSKAGKGEESPDPAFGDACKELFKAAKGDDYKSFSEALSSVIDIKLSEED